MSGALGKDLLALEPMPAPAPIMADSAAAATTTPPRRLGRVAVAVAVAAVVAAVVAGWMRVALGS